jgi:uncharacterized protein
MSYDIAMKSIDFFEKTTVNDLGIIFFGGEPLLNKDLISRVIEQCTSKTKETGFNYHYKVTTNGLLLDESFLGWASINKLEIALSIDGIEKAHDRHRFKSNRSGSYGEVIRAAEKLLKTQPYAQALMVVTPETVKHYCDSVEFLLNFGFKYIVSSLNYAAEWTDRDLKVLEREYKKIAELYSNLTLREVKFYFSPFDSKISSFIKDSATCQRCILGQYQLSVAQDGDIYPCIQFVKDGQGNKAFSIGNVFNGFNYDKLNELQIESKNGDSNCQKCDLLNRCNNNCSCLNWQSTGKISKITPFLCESERILIETADRLAEKLYKVRSNLFIQKHYNNAYPFLSLLDDIN